VNTGVRGEGRVGEYRIVRHWASGDTSQVYLARRGESATLIALKTPSAERSHQRDRAERFAHEVNVAERADHDNVVQSFESFEHGGERFLAMEFLHGETLHDVLRAIHPERRMPAAVALEMIQRLARGLDHLHSLGALHGDVCPANVILTYDGRVKLIDLGGRCEGTSAYTAPEQARGEAIDARADIFSLGLILFELLTGQRVATAIPGAIPRLSDLVETDPELDALVMTALANDRRERFPTAEAFAEALLAYRARAVPGLIFESKLTDFMEQNFSGRARSLASYLAGDRPRLAKDRLVSSVPPLGYSDPIAMIEAALRAQGTRLAPVHFADPAISTGDVGWSGERTNTSDLRAALTRSHWWIVGLGLVLIAGAATLLRLAI
jgi:eukaryotic-like serine/threonine-protein kinase